MIHFLYCAGIIYLTGVLVQAALTRKTFGRPMGFYWWAPLAFGFLWPLLLFTILRMLWQERK